MEGRTVLSNLCELLKDTIEPSKFAGHHRLDIAGKRIRYVRRAFAKVEDASFAVRPFSDAQILLQQIDADAGHGACQLAGFGIPQLNDSVLTAYDRTKFRFQLNRHEAAGARA